MHDRDQGVRAGHEVELIMRRERIGAIPIVDGGRLVGILARSDVLDAFVKLAEQPAAVTG